MTGMASRQEEDFESYDVLVIGGGYGGAMISLLLSRRGLSVCMVDRAEQPRFAIGESTTYEQNRCHRLFAEQYDVPELMGFTSYWRMKRAFPDVPVWPKESFYFHQQTEGEEKPQELLFQTVPWPVGPDYHCLRSAYDLELVRLATRYGVHYLGMTELRELQVGEEVSCVAVGLGQERHLRARFVVDASGRACVLGRQLGLLDADPSDIPLRSYSIFNHFLGVGSIDDEIEASLPRLRLPRKNATQHFLFDEGWFWVIPFDNGVTSVGVVLNIDRDPCFEGDESPHAVFFRYAERIPALRRMMQGATAIRPWVRTGRLQQRTRGSVGESWAILPPGNGFLDPFLSPGNALLAPALGRLAEALDEILNHGRPASEALQPLVETFDREMDYLGKVLHLLFLSFGRFPLFRELFLLYRLGVYLSGQFVAGEGATTELRAIWGFDLEPWRKSVDAVYAYTVAGIERGATTEELVAGVRDLFLRHDFLEFMSSGCDRPRDGVAYYFELFPILRWVAGLNAGAAPGWLMALAARARRDLHNRLRRRGLPRARAERLAWRHVRVLLGFG